MEAAAAKSLMSTHSNEINSIKAPDGPMTSHSLLLTA